MIVDGILFVVQGILSVLLLPLKAINIGVDFVFSISLVNEFLQVVAYLLPLDNLTPLFSLVIIIFIFRAVLALIKLIWSFIPVIGN